MKTNIDISVHTESDPLCKIHWLAQQNKLVTLPPMIMIMCTSKSGLGLDLDLTVLKPDFDWKWTWLEYSKIWWTWTWLNYFSVRKWTWTWLDLGSFLRERPWTWLYAKPCRLGLDKWTWELLDLHIIDFPYLRMAPLLKTVHAWP